MIRSGAGPVKRQFDRGATIIARGFEIGDAERRRQFAQHNAVAPPPFVGDGPEEFEHAAVLPQQHSSDRGGELRSDPGMGHVADIFGDARLAPHDFRPAPPTHWGVCPRA